MKHVLNLCCAVGLLATVGCDHIRDYSVNSYQGVLPVDDTRPAGYAATSRSTTAMPAPAAATPAASSTK